MSFLFRRFIRAIYTDTLQPDDDYRMRCRKAAISAVFCFSVLGVLVRIIGLSRVGKPLDYVITVSAFVSYLVWISSWIYTKIHRTAPDWLMNIYFDIPVPLTLLNAICSPGWGYEAAGLGGAIAAVSLGAPHWRVQAAGFGLLFLLSFYDEAFYSYGYPGILLPGAANGVDFSTKLGRKIINGIVSIGAFCLCLMNTDQYSLIIAKSAADVQLARDVTEKLVANDTEGAVSILDDAKQKPDDVVDSKLVHSFDGLRTALEAFFKYVPRHVVTYLSKAGTLGKIGMRETRATFSFTDIKGFTTLSTRVKPEALANMLTMFFEIQTTIVEAFRGVVDKYIGDCLMVLWGVLEDIGCPNLRACCAALALDRATRIPELYKAFAPGKQPLAIRTGIHGGSSLAGNMGSLTRMNYTVIGDAVNTAARLEPANKDFGTRILASEDVVNALENGMKYIARRLMTNIRVVGRDQALRVYEIMGIMPEEDTAAAERPATVKVSDAARSEGPSPTSGEGNATGVKLEESAGRAGKSKDGIQVLDMCDDTGPSAVGVGAEDMPAGGRPCPLVPPGSNNAPQQQPPSLLAQQVRRRISMVQMSDQGTDAEAARRRGPHDGEEEIGEIPSPPLSPTRRAVTTAVFCVPDIKTPEILTHARTMCHIVSREEAQWAKEFSDAVEAYAVRDFEKAIPLLQAAIAKATREDDIKLLCTMLDDCHGARLGVIEGKNK